MTFDRSSVASLSQRLREEEPAPVVVGRVRKGETEVEYRVVVGYEGERPIAVYDLPMDLMEARTVAREERGDAPVRIDRRNVTRTPWVPLAAGENGEG